MIFDDDKDKKRRKKEMEEFEKIVREMEKIIEEAFRSAFNMQPFVKGFSLSVENFDEEDIIVDGNKLYVTVELPQIKNEKDLKIKVKENVIEIKTPEGTKEIELPYKIKKKIKKTFRNGILDIEAEKY